MNINEALKNGREVLLKNDIDPREARLLLVFVLNIRNEELIKIRECSNEQYKKYKELLKRRALGEPYAYIVGYKEFMKLKFKVTPDVLIPREDTETLVQEIIQIANKNSVILSQKNIGKEAPKQKILDMCTGSGCIAISLAKYIANSELTAVDISENALKLANENAILNDTKINFIKSNLFENIVEKFDIIVSNPPYIKRNIINSLQKEVKNEPIIALDGGITGLDFYETITKNAYKYLNPHGLLAFEIGYDQAKEVSELMQNQGYENITVIQDLGKNDRVVCGTIKN